jgi:hypothetical protein
VTTRRGFGYVALVIDVLAPADRGLARGRVHANL